MRFQAAACALMGALAAGCQTITEELPGQPTGTRPLASPVPVQEIRVVQIALPVPAPTPTPNAPAPGATPTPAPAPQATPTPTPQATPTPAPQATPAPDRGSIDDIRVGFFGITCGKKSTRQVPNNGWRQLPVGCRGFVTATPKRKDNSDVPAKEHGPDIAWQLRNGHDVVEVQNPTFASDFNKDLVGRRLGSFSLCATVKGVTGCLHGTVIP